jgi:hypothetical protein
MENKSATKKFVEIENIVDSVVILRGGALRSVIEVTSVNFELKSTDEQQGIIQAFQGFLNTVDFPLQLLSQSRKLDINKYLAEVASATAETTNELLRVQTEEYARFIKGLNELANIMTKKFYIIVPYYSTSAPTDGFFDKIKAPFSHSKATAGSVDANFAQNRSQLEERVNVVSNAITGVGVTARVLTEQELITLYYGYYNFGQTVNS